MSEKTLNALESAIADEDKRIAALRVHLDDETVPMTIFHDRIIVNERNEKMGTSPEECKARVELLRQALSCIKPREDLVTEAGFYIRGIGYVASDELTIDHLRMISYGNLTRWFQADCPDLLKVGIHDVVNTLYALIKPCLKEAGYEATYQGMLTQAWNNEPIIDNRPERYASDGEYLVVTDEEADRLWDEELDQYIDDCMEIPERLRNYFDVSRWKADARIDGRGHALSSYDGSEHMVEIDGEQFFIFRTN